MAEDKHDDVESRLNLVQEKHDKVGTNSEVINKNFETLGELRSEFQTLFDQNTPLSGADLERAEKIIEEREASLQDTDGLLAQNKQLLDETGQLLSSIQEELGITQEVTENLGQAPAGAAAKADENTLIDEPILEASITPPNQEEVEKAEKEDKQDNKNPPEPSNPNPSSARKRKASDFSNDLAKGYQEVIAANPGGVISSAMNTSVAKTVTDPLSKSVNSTFINPVKETVKEAVKDTVSKVKTGLSPVTGGGKPPVPVTNPTNSGAGAGGPQADNDTESQTTPGL